MRSRIDISPGSWVASLRDAVGAPSVDPDGSIARSPRALTVSGAGDAVTGIDVAENSSCRVIFDGVLYNGDRLQRADTGSGAPRGPAELLLHAYLDRGLALLEEIRGIFGLIIWDARSDLLFGVRDQLGIFPLFYVEAGSDILLSTSIEALVQDPRTPSTVNRALLVDHLLHRIVDPEETYFRAIRRVPAGHAMRVEKRGRPSLVRYWDPAPPGVSIEWIREDEIGRFGELFDQAVDRSLGIGAAGIYLSGGLDSVSVAAVAADNTRRSGLPDTWALSLAFPDPECNEEAVQRDVARALRLPQVLIPLDEAVGERGLLASGLELNRTWPAPVLNFWLPAYAALASEGARRGCRVILTGGGGDEWLGVSPYLAADLLRSLDLRGFTRFIASWSRSFPLSGRELASSAWRFGARPVLAAGVRGLLEEIAPGTLRTRRHRRNVASIPDWIAPEEDLRREVVERGDVIPPQGGAGELGYYLTDGRRALDHPLVSVEMEENFEYGRRLGLLLLHPYWDPDLVDFLYRTPPRLLAGGRTKDLVRRLLSERFPNLGFERQRKVVSTNFFRSRVLDEGRQAWLAVGELSALADLSVVDPRRAGERIETILGGRELQEAYRVLDLLGLEVWARARA